MPSNTLFLTVGVPAVCLTLAASYGPAADDDPTLSARSASADPTAPACERSADRMLNACMFGLGETQQRTIALCIQITDSVERWSCLDGTRETRREELQSCFAVRDARRDACQLLREGRYMDPLASAAIAFMDPDDITQPNPYVSLAAGHTYVLRAGEEGEEVVVVHVTQDSREILGVPCRIVKDVVFEEDEDEYEVVEFTDDWFAQDAESNVYYCGEISRNYEDGVLRNLGGSFEAGVDFAKAGELILAVPAPGLAHRQEYFLGEAEDIVQYVQGNQSVPEQEGGENEDFPCDESCLKTLEFSPLEPDASEFKYYRPGVGFVLAVAMEDGEFDGEREELVCVGDSLSVLDDCGLADPDALREQLCEIDPSTFCRE